MQERRTATPSEAIQAVSRLLAEVAESETPEAFRTAVEREARELFSVDDAGLREPDALPSGEDLLEVSDEASGGRTLLVAIRHREATGCVLALTRREPFTADERELAAAFAVAAGGALAQVRLAEERERRIAQLSALARAAKTVNEQNPELAPLLTAICAEARSITGADAVAIYLSDDEGGVVAEAAHGLGEKMIGYRLAHGEGLAGRVAQEGRPLAAADYQELAAPRPDSPVADVRSAMAVPLYWDGSLRGVLSVGFERPHPPTPEEMRLLETFGELASAACSNANAATGLALAARTDALTGCLNHAALHEGLRLELERCARTDQGLAVVMLDLDEFKQVNERYGHLVGDEVLRRAGHALRSAVRPYDLCARYGGDEFVIVCSDADEDEAAEVATRAMHRLDDVLADLPEAVGTGSTAGVARWAEVQSPTELLEQADRALLFGKQQGHRHEVVLASELPETFRPGRFRRAGESRASAEPLAPAAAHAHRQAERLQKRSRQLLLASALGTTLAGMREPEAIVKVAADELHRAFGYFLCEIVRVRDDDRVEAAAVGGEGSALAASGWSQPREAGCIGRALIEGRVVVVNDIRAEAGYEPLPESTEVLSELVAPIRVGGRLWGAINVEEVRTDAFDDEDARLVQIVADQLGAALHSADIYAQLERAYLGTADALSVALDARDAGSGHGEASIAALCHAVGRRLGMNSRALRGLRYGAALHDVGKISVPEAILEKAGALEPAERAIVEGHPLVGERIAGALDTLADVSPVIRHEHERWDGHGYPDHLAGKEIPLAARILCACDAYQAMVSDRAFRPALPEAQARGELRRNAGTQFDPEVVDALLAVLGSEPSEPD